MTKLGECFTKEQRKKAYADARNKMIGNQFRELISACYLMEASITKVYGKLERVTLYKSNETFAPIIDNGVVKMILIGHEYKEYTVEEFIEKYRRRK